MLYEDLWRFRARKNKANSKPIKANFQSLYSRWKGRLGFKNLCKVHINGCKRAGGCRGNGIISLNLWLKNV